jgi:hypothetical protein
MLRAVILFLAMSAMIGCSKSVPAEKVPGTYVASYPFGRETLILDRGGTFTQRVELEGEAVVTVSGTWKFDQKESYLRLQGLLSVVDGFGHLNNGWRKSGSGTASLSVERLWFKINIGSGGQYPYIKR